MRDDTPIPASTTPHANERLAVLFALSAVMLWSTVATAFKLALVQLAPADLLLRASAVSAACFWIAAAMRGEWRLPRVAWPLALTMGLLNPVLYYLALFEGYARLPAQIAQPLNYTWVLMLAILAVPLLHQPLRARTVAGLVVSYCGVLLVLSQGSFSAWPAWNGTGIVLILASTLLWALYWIVARRADTIGIPLLAWSFTLALPALAAIVIWQGHAINAGDLRQLGLVVWIGLVEMGVTFLLWRRALALTRHAARIGQLVFLAPFLSLFLIGAILGESVTAWSVGGLAVIVLGILVAGAPDQTPESDSTA